MTIEQKMNMEEERSSSLLFTTAVVIGAIIGNIADIGLVILSAMLWWLYVEVYVKTMEWLESE